jgi:hypothetical protein
MTTTQKDSDFPHEDYATLLRLTAPGTTRQFHSKASITNMDLVMADVMCDTRSSGLVLPKLLRKKLLLIEKDKQLKKNKQQQSRQHPNQHPNNHQQPLPVKQQQEEQKIMLQHERKSGIKSEEGVVPGAFDSDSKNKGDSTPGGTDNEKALLEEIDTIDRMPLSMRIALHEARTTHQMRLPTPTNSEASNNQFDDVEREVNSLERYIPDGYIPPQSRNKVNSSYVFTTTDLIKKMAQANAALIDIQKQLHRGEELYHQETDAHGNMYKGWETFIDVKAEQLGIPSYEIGSGKDPSDQKKGAETNNHTPARRMNNDMRWFSLSSSITDHGMGRSERKRSKRSLTSSSSPMPVSGRSSRSVADGTSSSGRKSAGSPTRSPVTSQSSTMNLTSNENKKRNKSDLKHNDSKRAVVAGDPVDGGSTNKSISPKRMKHEASTNQSSANEHKRKKEDPPSMQEEKQRNQKLAMKKDSTDADRMKGIEPKDTKEKLSSEKSTNRGSGDTAIPRKRKNEVLSSAHPDESREDLREEDDTNSKKGRPRKRKK